MDRKRDKTAIPVCSIMGVNIAAINMEWLLEYTKQNIDVLSGEYMCVSNVYATVFDKYRVMAGIERECSPKDLKRSMKRYAAELMMEWCG